mgnify:CR=1 FL=1
MASKTDVRTVVDALKVACEKEVVARTREYLTGNSRMSDINVMYPMSVVLSHIYSLKTIVTEGDDQAPSIDPIGAVITALQKRCEDWVLNITRQQYDNKCLDINVQAYIDQTMKTIEAIKNLPKGDKK